MSLLCDVRKCQEEGEGPNDLAHLLERERLDDLVELGEGRVPIAGIRFPQRFALLPDALDGLVDLRPCLLPQHLAEEVSENPDVDAERLIGLGRWIRRVAVVHVEFIAPKTVFGCLGTPNCRPLGRWSVVLSSRMGVPFAPTWSGCVQSIR